MKTRIIILLLLVVLVPILYFTSCSRLKNLAAFDVSYTLPRTTFTYTPTSYKDGEQLLFSDHIEANLDSILNANGVSSGIVGNTTFTRCSITIIEPSDMTFGWLQSARGEISQNADFSPAQEVGYVTNNDPDAKTVVLTLNNTNIRPYLGNKYFYFRIFGVLNGPVPGNWAKMYIDGQLLMHIEPLN